MESSSKFVECHVACMLSLHVCQQSLFHEHVKVEPGLSWEPHKVGATRAIGYWPRRAADRVQNQPKKRCVGENKGRSELFEFRHGETEFGVVPARFVLFWSSVSSLPRFSILEWDPVPLYVGST